MQRRSLGPHPKVRVLAIAGVIAVLPSALLGERIPSAEELLARHAEARRPRRSLIVKAEVSGREDDHVSIPQFNRSDDRRMYRSRAEF